MFEISVKDDTFWDMIRLDHNEQSVNFFRGNFAKDAGSG